jgi:hypothetical protein
MIRLLLIATLQGLFHVTPAQENQITQYGQWLGWWAKARLSAYSPHDALDREYHESKGERWRWITADGKTDVRKTPYGIAATSSLALGSRVFIPTGYGYLDQSRPGASERVFWVDDRGALLERAGSGEIHLRLDLRYRTEYSALAFGVKDAWVFIITGDAK